jgi:hypothetical protein
MEFGLVGTIGWDKSICTVYPLDVNGIYSRFSLYSIMEKLSANGSRISVLSLYTNTRRNLRFSPFSHVCGRVWKCNTVALMSN